MSDRMPPEEEELYDMLVTAVGLFGMDAVIAKLRELETPPVHPDSILTWQDFAPMNDADRGLFAAALDKWHGGEDGHCEPVAPPAVAYYESRVQPMAVCPDCGSKRCPKAGDASLACTGDPGEATPIRLADGYCDATCPHLSTDYGGGRCTLLGRDMDYHDGFIAECGEVTP